MEASVYNLSNISDELIESAANLGLRVLVAIVLYIVGKFIIALAIIILIASLLTIIFAS